MVSWTLFEPALPPGFQYRDAFLTTEEEEAMRVAIDTVTFSTFEMRGVVARRRVAFFGESYRGDAVAPLPSFLLPARAQLAEWAGVPPDAFVMALINEYHPGTAIGWHRDAPQYDLVAGISLLSPCRMKFRKYQAPSAPKRSRRLATCEITLDPRSAYLMAGESREQYEHHIPPVKDSRYSVTFRTLRVRKRPRRHAQAPA